MSEKSKLTGGEVALLMVIGIPVSVLLSCLNTWAIIKVCGWYKVPLQLSFLQLFAIMAIVGHTLRNCQKSEKRDLDEYFAQYIIEAFYIPAWAGLLYIVSYFI